MYNVALTQHVTPTSHLYDILHTEPITVIHRLTAKVFFRSLPLTPQLPGPTNRELCSSRLDDYVVQERQT